MRISTFESPKTRNRHRKVTNIPGSVHVGWICFKSGTILCVASEVGETAVGPFLWVGPARISTLKSPKARNRHGIVTKRLVRVAVG